MKPRLLIIIGIAIMSTIPLATFVVLDRYDNYLEQLEYETQRISNEPKPGDKYYIDPERRAELEAIEYEIREKITEIHQNLAPSSYAVNLDHHTQEIVVLVENEQLNSEIESIISQYPKDIPIVFINGKISLGDPPLPELDSQECAELFDKIFYTWKEHVDKNYGGPGQPILEPPTVQGLIAGWEGGYEFRNSNCRYTVDDWAYLVENQDHVWGHVDWPKLESFSVEQETEPEISCADRQVILYDDCVYVLSSEDIPPKHDRYFIQTNDTITQICRESWGDTADEKCHDISSYEIIDGRITELETENDE